MNLKLPVLPMLLAAWSACAVAQGQDVVTLRRVSGAGGQVRAEGQIVDWTGQELVLRTPTGAERRYAADRIVDLQTARTESQQQAQQAMAVGQWEPAARLLQQATNQDKRTWMRRRMLADMALCHQNSGKIVLAVDTFAIVYNSDSTTELIDRMPLAWTAVAPSGEVASRGPQWLAADQAAAVRLMGASWMLTSQRDTAVAVLRQLLQQQDKRVAALAEAQLWRSQLVVAREADVVRWRQRLRALPAELRCGPSLVVGQALSRLGQHEQAAIVLMRAPIERPDHVQLASESLLAAAGALEKMGRSQEAERMYAELTRQYAGTQAAAAAKNRAAPVN